MTVLPATGHRREDFFLSPRLGHLNHGAYGATPKRVLRAAWRWQRRLESSPVEFYSRRFESLLRKARSPLAEFLGSDIDHLAFVQNTTTAVNWILRSLPWKPGDQILLNNHEYGAVERACRVVAGEKQLELVTFPIETPEQLLGALEDHAGPRTRLVIASQITSATALRLPIEEVGRWCRARGVWSLIDGAHAPGQIDIHLDKLEVDFWAGNLHKWMWAPKGSALLWAHKASQKLLRPVMVSWGVDSPIPLREPEWIAWVQMQATRDLSPFLASPEGLDYQRQVHLPLREAHCLDRMDKLTTQLQKLGAQPLGPRQSGLLMRAFRWPYPSDPERLRKYLFHQHRLEVPCYLWNGQPHIRISLQHYVLDEELERLLKGLSVARIAPSDY